MSRSGKRWAELAHAKLNFDRFWSLTDKLDSNAAADYLLLNHRLLCESPCVLGISYGKVKRESGDVKALLATLGG